MDKIEGDALSGQESARIAGQGGEDVAGLGGGAVLAAELGGGVGAVGAEDGGEEGEAGEDDGLAGDEIGAGGARGGAEGGRGAIAVVSGAAAEAETSEVFVAGGVDEIAEMAGVEIGPSETLKETVGESGAHG